MFQLKVLSGKQAGAVHVARRFPFRVGRNADADLASDEAGVWVNHLTFDLLPGESIRVTAQAEPLMTINNERRERAWLRNGDLIEAGALKLRFWLSDVQLVGQSAREILTWAALVLLFAAQAAAIWWLA